MEEGPPIFGIKRIIFNKELEQVSETNRGPFTNKGAMESISVIYSEISRSTVDTRFMSLNLLYPQQTQEGIQIGIVDLLQSKFDLNKLNNMTDLFVSQHPSVQQNYITQLQALIPRPLTEEEVAAWSNEDPKSFAEFLDVIDDTSNSEGEEQHNLEFHYESLLEHIGLWLTIELGWFTASEMKSIEHPETFTQHDHDQTILAFRGSQTAEDAFKDVYSIIETRYQSLIPYYNVYFLLKSLCFVLHDKPVNEFAKVLYDHLYPRTQRIFYTTENQQYLDELWVIWQTGFNLPGAPKVTQTRCHAVIDRLTVTFNARLSGFEIVVPKKILVFSTPYSVFKSEDEKMLNEMKNIMSHYTYGLGDAVGNDKFIGDFDLVPVLPVTCAAQDAASTKKEANSLIVIESTSAPDAVTGIMPHIYRSPTQTYPIQPIRFGDWERILPCAQNMRRPITTF